MRKYILLVLHLVWSRDVFYQMFAESGSQECVDVFKTINKRLRILIAIAELLF